MFYPPDHQRINILSSQIIFKATKNYNSQNPILSHLLILKATNALCRYPKEFIQYFVEV